MNSKTDKDKKKKNGPRKPTSNPEAKPPKDDESWRHTGLPYGKKDPEAEKKAVAAAKKKAADAKKPKPPKPPQETWRTDKGPYDPKKPKNEKPKPKPKPKDQWRGTNQPASNKPTKKPTSLTKPQRGWTGKFTNLMKPMSFYTHKGPTIKNGSKIKLGHVLTRMVLHSHNLKYNTGSRKQEITGFWARDDNDWWIVEAPNGNIKSGGKIKLKHMLTGKYLSAENQRSPTSGQREANGNANANDQNNVWAVIIDNSYIKGDQSWKVGDVIRLSQSNSGQFLHSHNLRTKVSRQQEVTTYKKLDNNNYWSVIDKK